MDITALVSLAISLVALATSGLIAVRQAALARNANHLALVTAVMQNVNGDLLHSEDCLRAELTTDSGPLSGLPEPIRGHALRTAYEYQTIGYLSRTGVVDRDVVRHATGVRVVNAWTLLAPAIQSERERNPGRPGFRFFEDLAVECSQMDTSSVMRRFRLRAFERSEATEGSG